jgi:hypothetical protein
MDVKFGACRFWGVCLICCGVQAIFYHKLFTNSPTAPIWNIFNGVDLLEKKTIATKMKENGWVVGVVWGFEPFSHGNHHIRAYMQHVCLIQSISARKATHIKLGTCPGSSQCQLHFGTKVVLIGWGGCEWLPSECKNAHFQAFPPLTSSGFFFTKKRFLLLFPGSYCKPPLKGAKRAWGSSHFCAHQQVVPGICM